LNLLQPVKQLFPIIKNPFFPKPWLLRLEGKNCLLAFFQVLQGVHIVPKLSEGIWWSSDSIMYFLGSFGAQGQLPGPKRLIDCPLSESRIISPQGMNPDINVNKQTKQYITRAKLLVFYRA
jgi:hypothetical protein